MNHRMHDLIRVEVTDIEDVATNIRAFELQACGHSVLPRFEPGMHVDVHMGPEMVRQYTVCKAGPESNSYVIAVQHEENGQGGSAYMHREVRQGTVLRISSPRNLFPLADSDAEAILVAGGIGVTPIYAMARQLTEQGKPWKAYLYARSPERAAYFDELFALGGDRVVVRYGDSRSDTLDIAEAGLDDGVRRHYYCCGPQGMLAAFENTLSHIDSAFVHIERFQAEPVAQGEPPLELVLSRSGKTLTVSGEQTILDALETVGISIPCSCRQGYCGTCETAVLEGEIDHRDTVLSESERQSQRVIMPCVSRARSAALVLDL